MRSRADRRAWLDLPETIQGEDPCWIAPLRGEQARALDRSRNPFFERGEAEFFLGRRAGRPIGRISAATALPMTGLPPSGLGTFGFFECADDPEAAGGLLAAAEAWLASRGVRRIIGPMNFSLNQECGILVEGHDSPPYVLMNHNPPHYAALVEGAGYTKVKDLYAWSYDLHALPERLRRLAERAERSNSIRLRTLDPRRFEADVRTVLTIFNMAWKENWGFTAMREPEFDAAVRDLRRIVDPEMVLIAEKEGRAVGMVAALPNINEALAGLRGRLWPFGFLRLLWRIKVRGIRTARCLMLGIDPSERGTASLGLSVLLHIRISDAAARRGVARGEVSWTLEDNDAINHTVSAMGMIHYKTYRLYGKEIAA